MTYEMDESLLVGEASKSERAPRAFGVENKSMRERSTAVKIDRKS